MTLLGLGGYASSDEEDEVKERVAGTLARAQPSHTNTNVLQTKAPQSVDASLDDQTALKPKEHPSATPKAADPPASTSSAPAAPGPQPALQGPALGPPAASSSDVAFPPLADEDEEEEPEPADFETRRRLMHQLTLPPIPHVEIPPSPPGSPCPSATARIAQFLKLKKEGVHFNDRLASSSALRNPTLLHGQLEFAGLSTNDQYATTLPQGLKPVPDDGFPYWAYGDELNRAQERLRKKKERPKGSKMDFVAAKADTSANGRDAKRRREN